MENPSPSVTRPSPPQVISYFTVIQSTGIGADLRDNGQQM
jgi:hypothetical protein